MGMILRIASSRIVGQGDIVGRSGYFSLNLSANSVMRGRLDARRTLKSLVADLRIMLFCTAFGIAYGIQLLFVILMIEAIGIKEFTAQFIGIIIYGAVNFMVNNRITFR